MGIARLRANLATTAAVVCSLLAYGGAGVLLWAHTHFPSRSPDISLALALLNFGWASSVFATARLRLEVVPLPVPAQLALLGVQGTLLFIAAYLLLGPVGAPGPTPADRLQIGATLVLIQAGANSVALFAGLLWKSRRPLRGAWHGLRNSR